MATRATRKQESGEMEQLIAHETRRHKVRFWGRNYFIRPRLVDWVHGDGLQMIYFTPLSTRPDYYVVRIDSSIELSNWGKSGKLFCEEVLDDLYNEIENQFGRGIEEWEADNGRTYTRQNPFPALHEDCGSSWGLIKNFAARPR